MLIVFLFASFGVFGKDADTFAPLDPKIWDITTDETRNIYDAVVVRDVFQVKYRVVNRQRTIRIFSEAGKSAVDFAYIGKEVKHLKGRVVTRSGNVINFDGKKDLIEVLAAKTAYGKVKIKLLLPPGLTRDCVVQYSWDEPVLRGVPEGDDSKRYDLAEDYHVMEKFFSVDRELFPKEGVNYNWQFRVLYPKVDAPIEFKQVSTKGEEFYIWRNIPALKHVPYGNMDRNPAAPFLRLGWLGISTDDNSVNDYWARTLGNQLARHLNEVVGKPREYKRLLKEVEANLPQDHVDAMHYISGKLQESVRDLSLLHPNHVAGYTPLEKWDNTLGQRLNMAIKQGYATPMEQAYLFHRLIRDCGLPVKILIPSSLYEPKFDPKAMNADDLYWTNPIFMAVRGNEMHFFMPQMREYRLGVIPSYFRGVGALLYDETNGKMSFMNIPSDQAVKQHMDVHQYRLNLSHEGELTFRKERTLTGEWEARYRRKFYTRTREEQKEVLWETYDHLLPDWKITRAECTNPYDLKNPLTYEVEGTCKLDDSDGNLYAINPFPGVSAPLDNPSQWPEGRSQHIYMGQPFQQVQESLITLPEGYALRGDNHWERKNSFGTVGFQAQQDGNQIKVRLLVVMTSHVEHYKNEAALKQYLDWVQAAAHQRLAIVKGDRS